MSEIKVNTLSMLVDGKQIEIKKPSKLNFELNKALLTEQGFSDFKADPQAFAKKYDLSIDATLASQLKAKVSGVKNLNELQAIMREGEGGAGATAWAVAAGAYSVATSKVAVAF